MHHIISYKVNSEGFLAEYKGAVFSQDAGVRARALAVVIASATCKRCATADTLFLVTRPSYHANSILGAIHITITEPARNNGPTRLLLQVWLGANEQGHAVKERRVVRLPATHWLLMIYSF
jgi:hypothetical protein